MNWRGQHGWTLIELSAVGLFMAIVMVTAAWWLIRQNQNVKAEMLGQTLKEIATSASAFCAEQGDCSALSSWRAAHRIGVIPSHFDVDENGVPVTPSGHRVLVEDWSHAITRRGFDPTLSDSGLDGFVVGTDPLSSEHCVRVVHAIAPRFEAIWVKVGQTNTQVKRPTERSIDARALRAACGSDRWGRQIWASSY